MLRKVGFILFAVLLAGPTAFGQEWARKMFEKTSYDFGDVARDGKTEFEFVLSNIYLKDVHIAGVRSSCGCTSPRIKQPLLKTYEKGAIVAKFNTQSFVGRKGATVTVTFDKPFHAEVQLHVSGHIRSDVVFRPGSVQLGSVDEGSGADAKVTVDYAGRANWKIMDVTSGNPHISAKAAKRSRNDGQVSYELLVHLDPNAPAGYVKDHLTLVTNDGRSSWIPLSVEGHVRPAVTVSPAALFIGAVQPGKQVTRQFVVQGKKPFRIVSITSEDDAMKLEAAADDTCKLLHVVPVTFTAGSQPGRVAKTIRIATDLDEASAELPAHAVVLAP